LFEADREKRGTLSLIILRAGERGGGGGKGGRWFVVGLGGKPVRNRLRQFPERIRQEKNRDTVWAFHPTFEGRKKKGVPLAGK